VTTVSTRRTAVIAGACLVALCAVAGPASAAGSHNIMTKGTVRAAGSGSSTVTYDPEVVPTGAELSAEISDAGDGTTTVTLAAQGLLPDRGYAAHAHVNPCGATGADAGPHFQNTVDPAATPDAPSTDPAYANPKNEVWLDLHTDGNGDGQATTVLPFVFGTRAPRSVVIHDAEATATDAGQAGTAGMRAACITLPG
jgi:Cu-Zn family superoxide dismutase